MAIEFATRTRRMAATRVDQSRSLVRHAATKATDLTPWISTAKDWANRRLHDSVRTSPLSSLQPGRAPANSTSEVVGAAAAGLFHAGAGLIESAHAHMAHWGGSDLHPALDDATLTGEASMEPMQARIRNERIAALLDTAEYEWLPNDREFYGSIPSIVGVYASEPTGSRCRAQLETALRAWLALRLRLQLPIPPSLQ